MFLVRHDSGVQLELFFYPLLEPYKHYIPTSVTDLESSVQWCVDNDSACEEIAEEAYKVTIKMLDAGFVTSYTTAILKQAHEIYLMMEQTKNS